ncbi:MAG: DUF3090 domain-containing protein [Acidimicrobiales bacterium]
MSGSFELAAPDHFTAGTVGPPGQRTFFLQARDDSVLVTLKCEKQQVGALAEYLAGMLADLPEPDRTNVTEVGLLEPVEPAWAIGSLAVAWDNGADRFLLVAEELLDTETDESESEPGGDVGAADEDAGSVRMRLTREQVASFIVTARELLSAGRPPCPICGFPVDPQGHICPRSNGHRRPRL